MNTCDEKNAKFMGEALLNHAREICRYAKTYSGPIHPDRPSEERQKRKFVSTVDRMIREMGTLLLMANYKGVSRYCNREQIEAYIDEARLASIMAPVPVEEEAKQSAAQMN